MVNLIGGKLIIVMDYLADVWIFVFDCWGLIFHVSGDQIHPSLGLVCYWYYKECAWIGLKAVWSNVEERGMMKQKKGEESGVLIILFVNFWFWYIYPKTCPISLSCTLLHPIIILSVYIDTCHLHLLSFTCFIIIICIYWYEIWSCW